MVRPAGFEPAASWFVGKRHAPQGYVFNDTDSADMPLFGPFGVNWVGIWVGVFRGAEISTRPSGSARLGGSAQKSELGSKTRWAGWEFHGGIWIELSPSRRRSARSLA